MNIPRNCLWNCLRNCSWNYGYSPTIRKRDWDYSL